MALKDLLQKIKPVKEEKEEFVELDTSLIEEDKRIKIKVENLTGFVDTEKVQQLLREGNVVFLKIKDLRNKDINELKRCVERLKKTCLAMNGDMVGVDEDFLILTPDFARVFRGKAA
ncbi:MAG: cell division protein SepF [Candidatus Aenigmarchaeota archaeon]|nr:cell division protein SepF [Candidatus Aenigmarchaeota archaeon]